jgi:hypothetical protein
MRRPPVLAPLLLVLALAGCPSPLPLDKLADTPPRFDPIAFFTGRTASWGVVENRSGEPTGRVVTESVGSPDGADGLTMVQRLTFEDGTAEQREWHLRRTAPQRYEATANDMIGVAVGETFGRTFHWRWVLDRKDGPSVTLEQWMYLMDGGTMVNRTAISKLGIVLATVTEHFEKRP